MKKIELDIPTPERLEFLADLLPFSYQHELRDFAEQIRKSGIYNG